jgi:hypothetical protein
VTDFVETCRREWRRLRVPDRIADEMAADLAADLRDAENDGVPAEELLGVAASEPRAFAESWARERGLVSARLRDRLSWRAAAVVVGAGAVLAGLATTIGFLANSTGDSHRVMPSATPPINSDYVMVPNLIGLQRGQAFGAAGAAGLKFAIRYRIQKGPSSLDVVAQSPTAGATVRRGSKLVIIVRR